MTGSAPRATAPLVWTSTFASDVGPVRKVNEDACLDAADIGLWAVAAGMGGHEGGQMASRIVIDSIDCEPDRSSEAAFVEDISIRLGMANDRLRQISREWYEGRVIGSTVAVVLAYADKALCLWAGDSRIYLMRDGQLRQINRDHTAVEDMVDQGLINREQARNHRLRNVITRAIGAHDHLELEQHSEPVRHGDVLLLCTDGLNKVLSDAEIAQVLQNGNIEQATGALLQLSLSRHVPDNVTVCVVQVKQPAAAEGDLDDITVPQPHLATAATRPPPRR